MNKYKYTINGNQYEVAIGDITENIATVTVNGEEYYFMTDPVELEGGEFLKTQIYVWSKEISMSELSFDLSVRWNLRGSYSKKEMEDIELSGSYVYDGSVG